MLGGRAIGAIIGIISGCSLFLLLIACCIVYYRRSARRKNQGYSPAAQVADERTNENRRVEQTLAADRTTDPISPDGSPPPPSYEEATTGIRSHSNT